MLRKHERLNYILRIWVSRGKFDYVPVCIPVGRESSHFLYLCVRLPTFGPVDCEILIATRSFLSSTNLIFLGNCWVISVNNFTVSKFIFGWGVTNPIILVRRVVICSRISSCKRTWGKKVNTSLSSASVVCATIVIKQ